MWPLKRKGKEEEDSSDEKTEERGKKRGRPKGKKNEEHKPWGKRERVLLLSVLGATMLASVVLALTARSWKLPGVPRVRFPEQVFEETFVLSGSQTSGENAEFITEFKNVTENLSGIYGFSATNLHTGEKFGLHEDEVFQAASLIKLPMMSFMFEESEEKRLNLEGEHTLQEEDKVAGSGSLYYEDVGKVVTNRKLIELMGKQSDNTAFNIAINILGETELVDYIAEIGMRNTNYAKNETTTRDIANLFEKLWEGRLVKQENRDDLFDYLTDTIYENHLAAGIKDGIKVSHKYGRELHVVNDAGIVFSSKPYVVVIMSKGVVESEADEIFPRLTKIIHEGMTE